MNWSALFLALVLPLTAGADVYKCRLPGGGTEISNSPCPTGSGTVTVRPDETVSEANRKQAEQDVARMRDYVERREAAQRADQAAERANQPATATSARTYGDPDACLRELSQQVLEASQRATLEAECRSRIKPPTTSSQTTYLPAYGGYGNDALGQCIANVQRLRVSPAEQQRRIAQCEASYGTVAAPVYVPHTHAHPTPAPAPQPSAPTVTLCPPKSKNCSR